MKPLRWVFAHEPLLVTGVVLGVALFLGLRYGATASATAQASWPPLLFAALGFVRNFVTPTAKAAIDAAPGQAGPMADDVGLLSQFVGDAVHNPSGLGGMLQEHWLQIAQAMRDLEKRVTGLGHGKPVSPAAPVGTTTTQTLTKPVSEATTPAAEPQSETQPGDALAELATLVP